VLFLADADVLSEPTKPNPSQLASNWLRQHVTELSVSPIVLGELEYGILKLPSGRRRTQLLNWFASGITRLVVHDIDAVTGQVWAALLVELRRKGRSMPVKDSLIAATALQHDLTIATRNVSDFRHCGARFVNPFG
jgi:predicted nucleic acid-binding protein